MKTLEVNCNFTKEEMAKELLEDLKAVKDLLPDAEQEQDKE